MTTKKELTAKLGEFKNVKPLANNQVVLVYENGEIFSSYETIIGYKVGYNYYLTADYKYSTTTSKWCNKWLGVDSKTRDKAIKNGVFQMVE